MAETTAEVRRDIELTRERMSSTLAELERKLDLMQAVRDHPWPALAIALGAGLLLSGSRADVKAAAATSRMTRGARSRAGSMVDDLVATLVGGVQGVVAERMTGFVDELKGSIGTPQQRNLRVPPRAD